MEELVIGKLTRNGLRMFMMATVAIMMENNSISSRNSEDIMITLGNMYYNLVNLTDDTVVKLNAQGEKQCKKDKRMFITFPDEKE